MRTLVALAALLPVLSLAAPDTTALDAWLKRQPSIATVDADFVQERKLPALKAPVTTPGHVSLARPAKLRWELGNPPQTLAISNGETMTLMQVTEKRATRVDADSPEARQYSLIGGRALASPAAFHETFDIIESRVSSGIHQYTLQPKDRRLRANVPWLFLDIDPARNELRAFELELKDKSRIRTIFSNVRLNAKLADSLFQADLTGYSVR
jgi:outer membrane lipoprotein carrier protein